MMFTDAQQLTGLTRYPNLYRFEEVLKAVVVGYSNNPYLLSSWFSPGPSIVGRCSEEEIESLLIMLDEEFNIDLSGLNYEQGKLFVKHFLLLNREFSKEELISYKKCLLN